MDYELRKYGNRIMHELRKEWLESLEEDGSGGDRVDKSIAVLDGMNNMELLAVMYVTGTAGVAFNTDAVISKVADCIRNRNWMFR